jgi:hypothetical protein
MRVHNPDRSTRWNQSLSTRAISKAGERYYMKKRTAMGKARRLIALAD